MISLLLVAVLSQTYYTPDEAKALFTHANEAYSREDFAGAEASFRKLLEHGQGGPDVLFNLGTTLLAKGDLGPAVLYLERARRLSPGDDDIEANLDLARGRQLDQVEGQTGGPFLQRFADSTAPGGFGVSFLVLWILGFGLVIARRFLPALKRRWLTAGAAASFVFALPLGMAFAAHAYVREVYREAVVLPATVSARDLPSDSGKTSFEIHAGLKVRILEEAEGYVRIRLPNRLEGWARRDDVAEI